ncbi:Hypothetical protein, putative [Bodo saltans]|uniref:Fanconi-associated nuclease n=1 Tax=Bodo saltans TaxID=75058 RepID=A0A0S4KM89_BODSA|nr:Hypothetical protein, putative [Bodo saltans]|eukprot:CUI14598.1 Hypothetical protein, putative [Bodo saltans]
MSFTQSDAEELRRSESLLIHPNATSSSHKDQSRRMYPSYVIKAYRYMVSYVLQYYANVLHTEEIAIWQSVLNMQQHDAVGMMELEEEEVCEDRGASGPLVGGQYETHHRNRHSVEDHIEQSSSSQEKRDTQQQHQHQHQQQQRDYHRWAMEDLLLRLACRKPDWFSVARLNDSYADLMSSLIAREVQKATASAGDDDEDNLVVAAASALEGGTSPLPVQVVVDRLASCPVHPRGSGNKAIEGQNVVCLLTGTDIADIFSRKEKVMAMELMSCLSKYSLREIALLLAQNVGSHLLSTVVASPTQQQQQQSEANAGSNEKKKSRGNKAASRNVTKGASGGEREHDDVVLAATAPQQKEVRRGSSTTLPDTKSGLMDFIFEAGSQDTQFPHIWDEAVGPIVRVHPMVKKSLRLLMSLFHVVTEYFPVSAGGGGGGAGGSEAVATQSPLPSSNIAVLVTLGNVRLPMMSKLPMFSFQDLAEAVTEKLLLASAGGGGGSSFVLPAIHPSVFRSSVGSNERLVLFSHRADLELYMEGLQLSAEMFDVCEGYARFRMRDTDWASTLIARCKKAFSQIRRLSTSRQIEAVTAETKRAANYLHMPSPGSTRKRGRDQASSTVAASGTSSAPSLPSFISVPQALQRYGFHAYHLTRYLPMHVWMRCAEYLVEMLSMQRRYEECHIWLKVLTEEPVYQVCASTSTKMMTTSSTTASSTTPVFRMWYRYQARGRWFHRIGQNLVHQGHHAQALKLMETCLEECSSLCCAGSAAQDQLRAVSERSYRMMRGMLDDFNTSGGGGNSAEGGATTSATVVVGWSRDTCQYHALMQRQQEHFLRRSDRMTMERLLVRLHKPPRRWCALPKHVLISTVKEARPLYLNGHKDDLAGGGWNDESLSKTACSVESHVLRWFVDRGRGRREKGWAGVHCEGSWIGALTRVVFAEAFAWHPLFLSSNDDDDERRRRNMNDAAASIEEHHHNQRAPFIWLSPFQDEPLDAHDILNFIGRRREVIAECIRTLRGMTQEAFVEFVQSRTVIPQAVQDADMNEAERERHEAEENENNAKPGVDGETHQADDEQAPMKGEHVGAALDECCDKEELGDAAAAACSEERMSNLGDVDDDVALFDDDDYNNPIHQPHDEDVVQLHQDDQREDNDVHSHHDEGTQNEHAARSTVHQVNISGIPQLRAMARCIPIEPLCKLYEEMFLSEPSEGHVVRFSGWPDLAVWRIVESASAPSSSSKQKYSKNEFCLVEVKSPTDKLSDKQIAVNDMLIRAGFDISVACVVNKKVIDATKAPRTRIVTRQGTAAAAVAQVQLTRRSSSSFVRGTATNPVEL